MVGYALEREPTTRAASPSSASASRTQPLGRERGCAFAKPIPISTQRCYRAPCCRAVAQWSELAAHNRLVAGSSLAGPPINQALRNILEMGIGLTISSGEHLGQQSANFAGPLPRLRPVKTHGRLCRAAGAPGRVEPGPSAALMRAEKRTSGPRCGAAPYQAYPNSRASVSKHSRSRCPTISIPRRVPYPRPAATSTRHSPRPSTSRQSASPSWPSTLQHLVSAAMALMRCSVEDPDFVAAGVDAFAVRSMPRRSPIWLAS